MSKQIIIDYNEYLELEKKSIVLEKLKKYISMKPVKDPQLNAIRNAIQWTYDLDRVLELIKNNEIDTIVKAW